MKFQDLSMHCSKVTGGIKKRDAKRQKQYHPAGDVTRVSVASGKVTVKIGDAGDWWRGCRDKNRLKKAKNPVRLVLSRVPFKSGNKAYKMPKYVLFVLVKPKFQTSDLKGTRDRAKRTGFFAFLIDFIPASLPPIPGIPRFSLSPFPALPKF